MLKTLKKYWFVIFVSTFVLFYMLFLGLIFFSPKEDALQRGFIPCTTQMAEDVYLCSQNKISCTSKAILKNNVCDMKVIFKGFKAWLQGLQKTPWNNYLFEPEITANPLEEDEELKAYYAEHLEIAKEMEELNKDAIALEKKLMEIKDVELPK